DPHDARGEWPIVDCNEVACRMNGYTRDELIGQSIDVLNAGPAIPGERAEYFKRLRHEGTLHLEAVHRHKDGTLFPVEVATSLVLVGGREIVLGIDRDITERKQTELALEQTRAELEERVEQRTAELSEANALLQASVADLVQTQTELRRSAQRYRSLVEASAQI